MRCGGIRRHMPDCAVTAGKEIRGGQRLGEDLGDDPRRRRRVVASPGPRCRRGRSTPGRRSAPASRRGPGRARPASARTASRRARSAAGTASPVSSAGSSSPASAPVQRAGRGSAPRPRPRRASPGRRPTVQATAPVASPDQRPGQHLGLVGPLLVRLREGRALHPLGRVGDPHLLPAAHLLQRGVEPVGRVPRVPDLLRGAPALAGPLLEQPDRVAVAAGEVAQLRTPASAVASATTTARSGIFRLMPTAAMVAALAIWSASRATRPSACTVQVRLVSGRRSCSRRSARTTTRSRPTATTTSDDTATTTARRTHLTTP